MKILLIHGSTNFAPKNKLFQAITKKITTTFFKQQSGEPITTFQKYLEEKGYEVELYKWSGNANITSIREEGKILHRKLKKEPEQLLFAISNGGLLAQYALLGLEHKLIQVGTPNINPKTNLHIINIYSNTDKTQQLGINFYRFMTGHVGSRKLYGDKVRNIAMDGLSHKELDEQTQYDKYEELIRKTN